MVRGLPAEGQDLKHGVDRHQDSGGLSVTATATNRINARPTAGAVTATPNTNTLPYQFVNWTEGGAIQSGSGNFSFVLTRDRTLTANFTLPAASAAFTARSR